MSFLKQPEPTLKELLEEVHDQIPLDNYYQRKKNPSLAVIDWGEPEPKPKPVLSPEEKTKEMYKRMQRMANLEGSI